MSFLQGEKRQLARANKEEADETEEEEVNKMHFSNKALSPHFQKLVRESGQF